MRKTWVLFGIALLSVVLAAGAIACGGDDDGGETTPTDTPAAELPTDTPEATEPEATASPEAEVTVDLAALAASGVTGTATLAALADGTQVEVTIDGELEEGSHISHIHTGSCAALGAIDAPLTNVEADASGAGTATTSIAGRPLSDFTDGNHYVAVHDLAANVVTCGDIEAAG